MKSSTSELGLSVVADLTLEKYMTRKETHLGYFYSMLSRGGERSNKNTTSRLTRMWQIFYSITTHGETRYGEHIDNITIPLTFYDDFTL